MGSKTVDDMSYRPEFITFNHRGRVQLTAPVSTPASLSLPLPLPLSLSLSLSLSRRPS